MNRTIIVLCLLLTSLATKAQGSYCNTFAEYIGGHFTQLEQLQMQTRSKSKRIWWGGVDFQPVTGDKATDKILKKQACVVMYHDSIYLNCRNLSCQGVAFGKGYARAYVFERDYLLFCAQSIKARQKTSSAALDFGLLGGAIAASSLSDNYSCYILNPGTGVVELIDKNVMHRLLEERNDLEMEYRLTDPKLNFHPETLLPFLIKQGLIEE